jgi:hypothetical protein
MLDKGYTVPIEALVQITSMDGGEIRFAED